MSESNDPAITSRYSPLAVEQRNNKDTRDLWSGYTSHRKAMTGMVQAGADSLKKPTLPTLCVLGAGNVNDLSLAELVPCFAGIRLVDFDRQAVEGGIARQAKAAANSDIAALILKRTSFVGPFDLSGISGLLAIGLEKKVLPDKQLQAEFGPLSIRLQETLSRQRPEHVIGSLGRSDVVVSACLLSQLVRQVNDVFGQDASASDVLSTQVIFNHLQLSLALTKPGGRTLFATDCLRISDEVSELEHEEDPAQVQRLADQAIQDGKLFTHLVPSDLADGLKDVRLRRYVASLNRSSFWKWKIDQQKHYLCYAIKATRSSVPWGAVAQNAEDRLADRLRSFASRTGVAFRSLGDSEIESRSPDKED